MPQRHKDIKEHKDSIFIDHIRETWGLRGLVARRKKFEG